MKRQGVAWTIAYCCHTGIGGRDLKTRPSSSAFRLELIPSRAVCATLPCRHYEQNCCQKSTPLLHRRYSQSAEKIFRAIDLVIAGCDSANHSTTCNMLILR
jgi:hypothetical protein